MNPAAVEMQKGNLHCILLLMLSLSSGCASTPSIPRTLGGDAFAFTPEQCLVLGEKQRTYKATQETATYASGLGAVLTGVFLAVFHDNDKGQVLAPALSTTVTAVSAGVGVFAGSQAKSLENTLAIGNCPR